MSFITCCPSCGTKFRVVADQLRISDGWVRCGRCQEVFDANQALAAPAETRAAVATQEAQSHPPMGMPPVHSNAVVSATALPAASSAVQASVEKTAQPFSVSEAPAPAQPPEMSVPAVAPAVTSPVSGYELPAPPEEPEQELDLGFEAPLAGDDDWLDQRALPQVAQPAATTEPVRRVDSAAASSHEDDPLLRVQPVSADAPVLKSWEPEKALNTEESQAGIWAEVVRFIHPPKPEIAVQNDAQPIAHAAMEGNADEDQGVASAQAPESVPSFVKQAQRKAWWSKPGIRFAMGMLLIFLPIALLVQIAVHERNRLAAWQPTWRAQLDLMCVVLRCEIAPYKNISAVVLTGSAFVQDVRPHHYKLDLSLQNQASMAVATPALELTLTDAQDQVLVRKVFKASEIGAPVELPARGEWTGTLPVMTQGLNLPVSGYRVMAFYP